MLKVASLWLIGETEEGLDRSVEAQRQRIEKRRRDRIKVEAAILKRKEGRNGRGR